MSHQPLLKHKKLILAMNIFHKRQGQMDLDIPYFYTISIRNFRTLLKEDYLKMTIISSLQYLSQKEIIEVYGYVIMPNHVHLIWKFLKFNGKESPSASFNKFTAHQFRKYLLSNFPKELSNYIVNQNDRAMQFWQRDPLAIPLSCEDNLIQKLEYIHANPTQEKWHLANWPEEYKCSSARFYLTGVDEFNFLQHFKS